LPTLNLKSTPAPRPPSGRSQLLSVQLAIGTGLVALSWAASWSEKTPLAHHSFFFLWLGYVLVVDGLVLLRTGTSLLSRGVGRFIGLFVVSIPLWWLFEALNARLNNWSYQLPHEYTWLAYHAEASLAFSTVVPALFGTAELFRSFAFVRRFDSWKRLNPGDAGWMPFTLTGAIMLGLVLTFPAIFFPLVWIGLFFLVDPVVHRLGGISVAGDVEVGRWALVFSLFLSGLTCGFFWEFWNSSAMPKWTYDIPYAEWLHLFEMPALGYGGYLPFALETFALVMLINRFTRIWPESYLFPPADLRPVRAEATHEVPVGRIVP